MLRSILVTAMALLPFSAIAHAGDKCLTALDKSIASDAVVQRQTILLKKERQRVIRRDCDQNVLSDEIEVMTLPEKQIKIMPNYRWRLFKDLETTVYNRTTCESKGIWNTVSDIMKGIALAPVIYVGEKLGNHSISFRVNSSSGAFMHVRRGQENFVDYSFANCLQREKDVCVKSEVMEQGTLILDVKYEERDLEGVLEINKTKEECTPKK